MAERRINRSNLCQLGPILMQTRPLFKTHPHQVDPFFISINYVCLILCILRQICKEMVLEDSLLQMMATLLKVLPVYLI